MTLQEQLAEAQQAQSELLSIGYLSSVSITDGCGVIDDFITMYINVGDGKQEQYFVGSKTNDPTERIAQLKAEHQGVAA
ncbi:hypothetical protein [Vibrio sp. SCSIO 43136]|uniref:hypothetical protein n=1 Tax=Vibrio sp. SCSIO 43136 TaxID=2819101 RepID=UPI002074B1B3|nr:hypothetical protein [Vibrio sp. SCSIO 43136]USD64239.1 hypothetical protein J4N39_08960 [Vibrio sp. SCSIO 43136]